MQENWQNFLKEQTAKDNSNIDLTKSSIVSPLSNFALLAVKGDDRHSFLHGQFINDLNLIEKPAAQLSAWCNPKGQVITNLIIISTGTSYLLLFRQELEEYVQNRLNMFIMRSDVVIENITESSPVVGVANINDLSALDSYTPTEQGEVHDIDNIIIISHPDNSGRYLITGSIEALTKKLPRLNKTLTSDTVWESLDILSGLSWTTTLTQEQFLPQMLNLDILNGLSYQKGCYPGQEVIARLHYRGEVKKRMQLINSTNKITIGDDILLNDSDKKVGEVINATKHPDCSYIGLAVIQTDILDESLLIGSNKITINALPYNSD